MHGPYAEQGIAGDDNASSPQAHQREGVRQRQHNLPNLLQTIVSSWIRLTGSALMLRIAQKISVPFEHMNVLLQMILCLAFHKEVLQVVGGTVSTQHRPKRDRAGLTAHADVSHASLREPAQHRAISAASSLQLLSIDGRQLFNMQGKPEKCAPDCKGDSPPLPLQPFLRNPFQLTGSSARKYSTAEGHSSCLCVPCLP